MASMIRRIRRNVARALGLTALPTLVKPVPATEPKQESKPAPIFTHKVTLANGSHFGVNVDKGGIKAAKAAAREYLNVSRLPVGTEVTAIDNG